MPATTWADLNLSAAAARLLQAADLTPHDWLTAADPLDDELDVFYDSQTLNNQPADTRKETP